MATRRISELGAESKRVFSRMLWKTQAIKFGTFTLTSGKLSSYYIDLRVLPSHTQAFRKSVRIYESLAEKLGLMKFDKLAGIPTAGLLYAAVLAYRLGKPIFYMRKEAKDWGRERRIEGSLSSGERALLVDDVITTGRSILEAAKTVRSEGGVVTDALVLVDREELGSKFLANEGIKLHSFVRVRDIARALHELGEITTERYHTILKQIV
ncbi:MAG: orotate phosphoribosyltransferase [Candidatus Bathyarchaeia archaeon]